MSDVIQQFESAQLKADVPRIEAGYRVAVHQRVKEGNKERVQIFEGVVLAVNPGNGINATITIRKVANGIGVEKIFPLHSPLIEKLEVKRAYRVRRAKLNFLRKLSGKSARLKEIALKS